MTLTNKKKWTFLPEPDYDQTLKLSHETKIPVPLSKILIRRGIDNAQDAKKFFIPELDNLYDPFLMKDMDKACKRIIDVISNKEKIMIFGDYDVDGTSGVSMLYCFLNSLGLDPLVFIPDRFKDGYGLSHSGIDHAKENDIKLIVAIDCGITAFDKVEYAREKGVEILICDHHQPPEKIPDAFAVLDTLQSDCNYPFKGLCGTGVAFKLVQAVCIKLGLDTYKSLLDFVAIATAADMVPVIDENRILVHCGFKQIIKKPRPSLETLITNSGFKVENINTSNVVFGLGPRINAVGRLGDAHRAVEFLTCTDRDKAEELALVLEDENTNRKKIDSEIFLQAQNSYDEYCKDIDPEQLNDYAIILHNSEWHPGVLGIIASRMVEKYYKPSIILTTFNGSAKGSARSVNNFNIYEALKQCSDVFSGLIQFGGHYHAAGVEIDINKIDEFRNEFNRIAKNIIENSDKSEDILVPEILIDASIDLNIITQRFVKIVQHFEPFGPGNMNPIFVSDSVQVVGNPKVYKDSTHVFKVRNISDDNSNKSHKYEEHVFECVYYLPLNQNGNELFSIKRGEIYDITFSVEENTWMGRSKVQLRVRDLRKNGDN